MISAEEIIKEFEHRAAELERDGERPVWTAQDIAVVIRNIMNRDGARGITDAKDQSCSEKE